ncbi:chemotaxis protein CheB [Marinitoga aeolica]|uniref:protein-glutamate methylesterase n=1 Tax=Marinitoga aeolica TaxID=2809031 RepID=A0ABY8PP34_9BACT|nr:chemotaxis protein CheB [Marinitoga aeolica]WGS64396.1 chemotaxis protein CheB [Marinitoga aeolica]
MGASAGGPQALKVLFNFNTQLKYPIILAMHNLENQTDNFKRYIYSISKQNVHIVDKLTVLDKGIYIPQGGKDLIFFSESTIAVDKKSDVVSPSINHLFTSLTPYADINTYVFLLGGLGNDGTDGLIKLENTNANIYIQKDAQFPYMTKSAMSELERYNLKTLKELNGLLLSLNKKVVR